MCFKDLLKLRILNPRSDCAKFLFNIKKVKCSELNFFGDLLKMGVVGTIDRNFRGGNKAHLPYLLKSQNCTFSEHPLMNLFFMRVDAQLKKYHLKSV